MGHTGIYSSANAIIMEERLSQSEEFEERLDHIESQNEEIIETLHFLRRAVYFSRAWAVCKGLIIIIPLVFGIFYLPSFLRATFENINFPIDRSAQLFFK